MEEVPTQAPGSTVREVMDPAQVAEYLGICYNQALELIKKKRLKSARLFDDSRNYKVRKVWVDEFLEELAEEQAA